MYSVQNMHLFLPVYIACESSTSERLFINRVNETPA